MFHVLLTLRREYVPLCTTSIANSKVSSIHIPLLVVEGTQFGHVDLLLCGLGVGGQFSLFVVGGKLSLFVVCKSSMLFCCLQRIVKFMITLNFFVLTSNNLVDYVLAQPRVSLFLFCKQPKNPKSVINLGIFLWHVLGVLH